jgi:hypothetical protein
MDLYLLTTAADKTCAAVTSATDLTVLGDIEDLVLGDIINVSTTYLTAASTYPAFAGGAGYTQSIILGVPTADGAKDYATSTAVSTDAHGWTSRLDLTNTELAAAVDAEVLAGRAGLWATLQVRVAHTTGTKQTYALHRVLVRARVAA